MRFTFSKIADVTKRQTGISLIEILVAMVLLVIAMGGITSMVITSMRTQQEVSADFRSQLNTRQVLYDMEKQIAEMLRESSNGDQPIFQDDLISFPTQDDSQWITYWFTSSHPSASGKYTIVRVDTNGMPTLPLTLVTTDKQMINVDPDKEEEATVEHVVGSNAIFTYFDTDGVQLATPVADPREVRYVDIALRTTTSTGHAQNEENISSTRIYLRNY